MALHLPPKVFNSRFLRQSLRPSIKPTGRTHYGKFVGIMFIPPGIVDALKYGARRLMRIRYSKSDIAELILIVPTKEVKLSVQGNCVEPFSLEVNNTAPFEITMQTTARLTVNGGTIADILVEEPSQTITKSERKSFSIRPFAVSEYGRQEVLAARSKMLGGRDHLDAVLSVRAVVRTWLYPEIQISRDLPLQIQITN